MDTGKEADMFARIVSLQLKSNSYRAFSELFDKEILPTLRKQPGCGTAAACSPYLPPSPAAPLTRWRDRSH